MDLLAQVPTNISGNKGGFQGFGKIGLEGKEGYEAGAIFASVISCIVGFLTIVAGLWFLFNVIIAGFVWLSAGGDKQKIADAQGKLTSSLTGLVVAVIGIFLVRLVANLLGVDLILDPAKTILELIPK